MAESFLSTRKVRSLPHFYRYRGGVRTRDYDETQKRYLKTGELPSSESLALETLLKKLPNTRKFKGALPAFNKDTSLFKRRFVKRGTKLVGKGKRKQRRRKRKQ